MLFLSCLLMATALKMCSSIHSFSYKNWTFLVHMTCGTNKCLGVLVKPNWVLTSASCLYTDLCQEIHVGELSDFFTVKVSGSIIYPLYEELPATLFQSFPLNDIALIRLKTKIDKVQFLNISNKVPDRNLKCSYLILKKGNLTKLATNNFMSCPDVKFLFNIPDVNPDKVKNVCNKICVTSNYVKSSITLWGGPLICDNQIQGIYSDSTLHDGQRKSGWTMPYAYSEWIDTVIKYNENKMDSQQGEINIRSSGNNMRHCSFTKLCIVAIVFKLVEIKP